MSAGRPAEQLISVAVLREGAPLPAPAPLLALPAPPKIASAGDPMPVDPTAVSELPFRTKCNLCPDKSIENVEQLTQHTSFMHFREEIEKAYITNWE